jgi:hypothetical protein
MSVIDSPSRESHKPSSLSSGNEKEKDVGLCLDTLEATDDLDPSFESRTMSVIYFTEEISKLNRVFRRYVDFRILPFLALVYSFSLIDRINLGAARTAGMGVALVCTSSIFSPVFLM